MNYKLPGATLPPMPSLPSYPTTMPSLTNPYTSSPTDNLLSSAAALPPAPAAKKLSLLSDTSSSGNAASSSIPATTNPDSSGFSFLAASTAATGGMNVSAPDTSGLAKTTFAAGPNEKLATVDVYSAKPGGNPVNSIQAISKSSSSPFLDAFKGGASGTKVLKSKVANLTDSVNAINSFNLATFMEGFIPGMGKVLSVAKGCGNSKLSDGMLSDINSMNGMISDMNGVSSRMKPTDLDCSVNLGNMVNMMALANGCGRNQFSIPMINLRTLSLKAILLAALEAGLLGIFGALICGIAEALLIDKLSSQTATPIAKAGDMHSLHTLAASSTPGIVVVTNPHIVITIVNNYNNVKNKESGVPSEKMINDTLIAIGQLDPKWLTTTTPVNGTITDLTKALKANNDFNSSVASALAKSNPTSPAKIKGNIAGCNKPSNIANFDLLYVASLAGGITSVASAIANNFPSTLSSISPNTIRAGINLPSNRVVSPLLLAA
jgi:hypothetical protein